jgi:mannan endo-1,4-beta-mannosidase
MIPTFLFKTLCNLLKPILGIALFFITVSCTTTQMKTQNTARVTNANATPETVNLYVNLMKLAPEHILFGHEDAVAYGIGWNNEDFRSDVNDVAGDFPAVFGWDIGKIGNDINIDSIPFERMRYWIIKAFEKGGINTISWHDDNPISGGDSWDTIVAVKHILPGGSHHETFLNTLDLVADFLESLVTADGTMVPIIFRPFHEHTGSWFWWGERHTTREEYIQLWHLTYQHLVETRKINNLLWAYSPDRFRNKAHYLDRFPGSEYVDVIGFDNYWDFRDINTVPVAINQIRMVVEIADSLNKLPAFTETGLETISKDNWWTEYMLNPLNQDSVARRIAWVMVWRNYDLDHHYAPFPGHPSAEDFIKFYQHPSTMFLNDLPDMYR